MVNLRELPDAELEQMLDTTEAYMKKIQGEVQRRETIASAEEMVNDLNLRYFQALGRADGSEWEGPSTASESYPRDWFVTHEYGLWKSRVAGNIEEPGEGDAWERVGDDPGFPSSPSETVLPGVGVLLTPGEADEGTEEEEWMVEDYPDGEDDFEGESDA